MKFENIFKRFQKSNDPEGTTVPVQETPKAPTLFDEEKEIALFPAEIAKELSEIRKLHTSEQNLKKQVEKFYAGKPDLVNHLHQQANDPNIAETKLFEAWNQEQLRIANDESKAWERLQEIMKSQADEMNLKYNQFRGKRTAFLRSIQK